MFRGGLSFIREPLLSPSIVEMALTVSDWPRRGLGKLDTARMDVVAKTLVNLQTLSIDGDMQDVEARDGLLHFIRSLPTLKSLITTSITCSPAILRAAHSIGTVERIGVKEFNTSAWGVVALVDPASPCRCVERRRPTPGVLASPFHLPDAGDGFSHLRHFAFDTSRAVHASGIILQKSIPFRQLSSLWIRFIEHPTVSRSQVRSLIVALSQSCKCLKSFTIRLAGRSDMDCMGRATPLGYIQPLRWEDISGFLLFPSLEEFSIDDSLALSISPDDLHSLARGGRRICKLWLNPFPLFADEEDALPVGSLAIIAKHCSRLQKLAVFVRVEDDAESIPRGKVQTFKSLQEFAVGWSPVPCGKLPAPRYSYEYTVGWSSKTGICGSVSLTKEVAIFMAKLFSAHVRLVTCTGHHSVKLKGMVCSDLGLPGMMSPVLEDLPKAELSRAWKARWALAMFYRSYSLHV